MSDNSQNISQEQGDKKSVSQSKIEDKQSNNVSISNKENANNEESVVKEDEKTKQSKRESVQQAPQLRKVAEKKEIPVEKDDLLQFLMSRLEKAEEAIIDTQALLLEERKKKQTIINELEGKDKLLGEILNTENQSIKNKVKNELKETLDKAMEDKINAEKKAEIQEKKMEEKNNELQEVKKFAESIQMDYHKAQQEIKRLNEENIDSLNLIKSLQKENISLKNESQTWNQQISSLKQELQESQQVVSKLNEVKSFLNKFNIDQVQNQQQYGSQDNSPMQLNQQGRYGQGGYTNNQHKQNEQDRKDDNFWYQKRV